MHNSQVRGERFLLIVAILANVVLVIVFVFLFGLIVNQPSEADAAATADDLPATEEPSSTETAVRGELPTIAIPVNFDAASDVDACANINARTDAPRNSGTDQAALRFPDADLHSAHAARAIHTHAEQIANSR